MNQIATKPRFAPRLPEELRSSTIVLLKRLGMTAKELSLDAYEEQEGMHPYHHAVLAVLDEGQRDTQGAIAEALGYDKGQLVGLLDELEEAELVDRQRDPNDRRRQIVRMTPAGRKHLEKLRKLSVKIEDAFLEPLSEKERAQLHSLLLRLAEEHLPNCRFAKQSSL